MPIASASRCRMSQSARKLEAQSRACDGLPPQNGSLTLPWMRRTCSRSRTIFMMLTGSSTA